jgi:hypothetical protein
MSDYLGPQTGEILCTFFGKGRCHDFAVFKASTMRCHPETRSLQDSGYQGMDRYHANSAIPKKELRKGMLSASDQQHNRQLSSERIGIEHINRRLKIFRILQQRYRNRRRRFGSRCNLIAALYNDGSSRIPVVATRYRVQPAHNR